MDKNRWYHTFQAMWEMMQVYDMPLDQPWDKQTPTWLYQCGPQQSYMPLEKAIDAKRFNNNDFDFQIGRQNNPAVRDIFRRMDDDSHKEPPVAPALLMKPDTLDGTSAPSYEAAERATSIRYSNNIMDENHAARMRYRFKSPLNQPRVGEINNGKAPMFINVDPRVKTNSEAVIYIQTEARMRSGLYRHPWHEDTRYDPRNDTASHFKTSQQYAVMEMVKIRPEVHTVNTVEELQISDSNGVAITQNWLDQHLDWLNGNKERRA